MKEEDITPALLQAVEDMLAEGLTIADVASLLRAPVTALKNLSSTNIEFRNAMKRGEERALMVDLDAKRRSRIEREATWFIPTSIDLLDIETKARLGWSEIKIAESFDVPLSVWEAAKKKNAQIDTALKRGEAQSQGKLHKMTINAWRPTAEDLKKITEYASEGLAPRAISVKLGYGSTMLEYHMPQIPEIVEAYEKGLKQCEAVVTNALMNQVRKGNVAAMIYFLKARNKKDWADSALPAQMVQSTNHQNGVAFEIPKQKQPENFAKSAEKFRKKREENLKRQQGE